MEKTVEQAEYFIERGNLSDLISIRLRLIDFKRYFADFMDEECLDENTARQIVAGAEKRMAGKSVQSVSVRNGRLEVSIVPGDGENIFADYLLEGLRNFYEVNECHITRMFGSFVYLKRIRGKLKAVHATPIPLRYCPLMKKLLTEIGGDTAAGLLEAVAQGAEDSAGLMCELIDEVVIKGGYFDTSRPLNSCEVNVLFGASETMSSAFEAGLIDAAVIVSNNLGTIITTGQSNTQGAVRRMTGLFATSPSKTITETAVKAGICPVFPHTGIIDQLEGVRKAISLGYRRIAVSVAWEDNIILEEIRKLERDGIIIYKFALCSTGLGEDAARAMSSEADLVWSCSSRAVKTWIEPRATAQVGIKIPVYIMNRKGWLLAENHLRKIARERDEAAAFDRVELTAGDWRPVILNDAEGFRIIRKEELGECRDCPHPCI